MKRSFVIGLVCAVTGFPVLADIIFTEIMYDPSLGEPGWEWVELFNNGSDINLNGWFFDDVAGGGGNPAVITSSDFTWSSGSYLILAHNTQTLSSFNAEWNTSLDAAHWLSLESTWPTLNNGGDWVRILDNNSNEVAAIQFTESAPWPAGGAVNASYSFNLDPSTATPSQNSNGANWSVSASGVNGSWQSSSGDWGSPGVVVPEPGTVALLVLGGGLIAIRRLRRR